MIWGQGSVPSGIDHERGRNWGQHIGAEARGRGSSCLQSVCQPLPCKETGDTVGWFWCASPEEDVGKQRSLSPLISRKKQGFYWQNHFHLPEKTCMPVWSNLSQNASQVAGDVYIELYGCVISMYELNGEDQLPFNEFLSFLEGGLRSSWTWIGLAHCLTRLLWTHTTDF